jgi:tetratricopeptide (TPR) repeat protein
LNTSLSWHGVLNEDTFADSLQNQSSALERQIDSVNFNLRSFPEKAKSDALRLLSDARHEGDALSEATILDLLGRISYLDGDLGEALDYGNMALELFEQKGNLYASKKALVYSNLANVYLQIGNHTKALEYYLAALEEFETGDDKRNLGIVLGNMGNLFSGIGNYEKAIESYQAAISIFRPINYTKGMAINNNNLGEAWLRLKQYDTAIVYYDNAYKLYESLDDKRGISLVLNNIGSFYQQQSMPLKALGFFRKSLQQQMALGSDIGIAETLSNIGALYNQLGNYDSSLHYLNLSQEIGEANGYIKVLELNAKNMTELYVTTDDYKNAFAWQAIYKNYSDSIMSAKSDRQLTEMQTKYETEQKEKTISLLRQENEIQVLEKQKSEQLRNFVIISLVFVLALIFAFFSIKNSKDAKKMAELERIALYAQMKPHFIFNVLSSIQTFILENDLKNADRYLSKFARLIRLILESTKSMTILLEDELNLLNLYIDIEKMRFDNQFEQIVRIEPHLNPKEIRIPSLLLQPFVENAIWHGLSHRAGKGKLLISIGGSKKRLRCIIEDDGVGRSFVAENPKLPGHVSMGLKLAEKRLGMFQTKRLFKRQSIIIEDLVKNGKPAGTRVVINIPYK